MADESTSGRQPDVLCLEVTGGPCRGAAFRLEGRTAFTVGRTRKSQVFIKDSAISERHALLSWEAGRWHLEDVGSSNGTAVNGTPLPEGQPCEVATGCQVRLGTDTKVSVEAFPADCAQLSVRGVLEAAAKASKERLQADKQRHVSALQEQYADFLFSLATAED